MTVYDQSIKSADIQSINQSNSKRMQIIMADRGKSKKIHYLFRKKWTNKFIEITFWVCHLFTFWLIDLLFYYGFSFIASHFAFLTSSWQFDLIIFLFFCSWNSIVYWCKFIETLQHIFECKTRKTQNIAREFRNDKLQFVNEKKNWHQNHNISY